MADFRAYSLPPAAEPSEIELSESETHHLTTVNRAQAGDTVTVFNGRGTEWICELVFADRRSARLKVRFAQKMKPLPYAMTLAQALPKGSFMDAIVRKATELGVKRIAPLESERTQVHMDGDRSERKIEKWQTAALEAAKQCGNPWLPEISPIQSVEAFVNGARGYDLKLIASLRPGAKPLQSVLAAFRAARAGKPAGAPITAAWLVGPEGDFSQAEMNLAIGSGFEPVTLGPLVLRCETAAVYALSVLGYELQAGI
jgi:16S rRNA (uracil1498-N3)-methyltransferase